MLEGTLLLMGVLCLLAGMWIAILTWPWATIAVIGLAFILVMCYNVIEERKWQQQED